MMWVGSEELRNSVSQVNPPSLPSIHPSTYSLARKPADLSPTSQLKFNPTNPSILYASFRRSTRIYSWDLRGDTSTPLQVFQASDLDPGEISNQKLMFDIDYAGRWLGVGNQVCLLSLTDTHLEAHPVFQRGGVRLFDLRNVSHTDSQAEPLSSTLEYTAHEGTIRFTFRIQICFNIEFRCHWIRRFQPITTLAPERRGIPKLR